MNEWIIVGVVVLGTVVTLGMSGAVLGAIRGKKDKTKE